MLEKIAQMAGDASWIDGFTAVTSGIAALAALFAAFLQSKTSHEIEKSRKEHAEQIVRLESELISDSELRRVVAAKRVEALLQLQAMATEHYAKASSQSFDPEELERRNEALEALMRIYRYSQVQGVLLEKDLADQIKKHTHAIHIGFSGYFHGQDGDTGLSHADDALMRLESCIREALGVNSVSKVDGGA